MDMKSELVARYSMNAFTVAKKEGEINLSHGSRLYNLATATIGKTFVRTNTPARGPKGNDYAVLTAVEAPYSANNRYNCQWLQVANVQTGEVSFKRYADFVRNGRWSIN